MYWTLIIVLITILVYICLIKPLTYWSRKSVLQKSVFQQLVDIAGNVLQFQPPAAFIRRFYNDYPNARYNGTYQLLSPLLLLRDPELIKQITVKDFDHFTDHNMFLPEDVEPLWGKNLFALKGDRWRDMRATLSPSFTSSKMKSMFVLMKDCAQQFVEYFENRNGSQVIDMKDAFTRFANDVIASAAFGISCNSLTEPNNEFYLMGKEATNFRGFWRNMRLFAILISPRISKMLGIQMFSTKTSNFFRRLVKTNIESREKNGIIRPDMIQLLMDARKGRLKHEDQKEEVDYGFAVIEESTIGKDEKRQKRQLTDDDLTAQALIFFFAGFDSVSTLMCFLIYEVAVNPDVQEILRKEVQETLEKCEGSLTYEGLLKMKYMDMVVSETMRKWPAQIAIDRVCIKPYTIEPVKEGEVPIYLKENQLLWLPVYKIHRDPELYPNPDRFDPERFSEENKSNINPYAYLPFGIGPRSCIGNRFALLETKTILFNILANFDVRVSEKTTVPLKLAKDTFTLAAEDGFWFELKPLKT